MANILLVEDDMMIREAFTIILGLDQHHITTAENGQIGIKLFHDTTFDLILLDIMMPVMDGVGFLKEYTANYHDVATKVILMSNLSSGTELSMVKKYGVQKVVLKSSLTPTVLLKTVKQVLEKS